MSKISKVWAREILDSRATPTVEGACKLDNGYTAIASVPSGVMVSKYEALELRDLDPNRFLGKGVLKAVANVNDVLGPGIWGMEIEDQEKIDTRLNEIDGTPNKSKMGANAILAVSMACCKAAAQVQNIPLYSWINKLSSRKLLKAAVKVPTAVFNMINGGLHGAGNLDFQEFHVIPVTSKNFASGLRSCVEIYMNLGNNLRRRGAIHSLGDEGGYAPNLFTNADALEVLVEAIRETTYQLGRDVFLGLDVAASVFYKGGVYTIRDKSAPLRDNELLEYYKFINSQYHLAMIEDPFDDDSWQSWKMLYSAMQGITIVGDDLLSTNPERVDKAIKEGACNGILVKPNQVGTVTETISIIKKARDAKWKVIVSHRSGETNDWFIADFAVGVGADYVKFGAPARGERVAKYNRLLAIEGELAPQVK